jgi:WhiB family redox-sensing transcriptional regulator
MCAACREIPSMDMPRWTAYASCKDPNFDPNWWWPEKSDDPLAPVAMAICRSCKVRDLCLDYAIQHKEQHGIWGGLMPSSRNAIAGQRRRSAS